MVYGCRFLCGRLTYKYHRLVNKSGDNSGELPGVERCVVDDDEEDEEEVICLCRPQRLTFFFVCLLFLCKSANCSKILCALSLCHCVTLRNVACIQPYCSS